MHVMDGRDIRPVWESVLADWLKISDAVLTARERLSGTYSKPLAVDLSPAGSVPKLMLCHEVRRIVFLMIYALTSIMPVAEQGEMQLVYKQTWTGAHRY